MRKFMLISLTVLMIIFGAVSCTNSEIEVPDGLQIIKNSEQDGYIFFGPEGWIVANDGDISASYVSTINNTSISFVEVTPPKTTVQEYFEAEKKNFAYEINVVEEKTTKFGNAESAYYYIYTFKYAERDFASMQIFAENAGRFYIFTYTSYGDPTDEGSEYQNYLEVVRLAIDSFKFTERKETAAEEPSYETDADGYVLVSDKGLSGFEFYVPGECEVTMSSAQVMAKFSDRANINITKSSSTGVSIVDYLKARKSELDALFGDVTDIKITLAVKPQISDDELAELFEPFDTVPTVNEALKFGNLEKSGLILYEYTYTYLGTVYHVYQVLGVNSFNGYVLTYTAADAEYEEHLDKVIKILEKVKF